jgi:hypothetical protein
MLLTIALLDRVPMETNNRKDPVMEAAQVLVKEHSYMSLKLFATVRMQKL